MVHGEPGQGLEQFHVAVQIKTSVLHQGLKADDVSQKTICSVPGIFCQIQKGDVNIGLIPFYYLKIRIQFLPFPDILPDCFRNWRAEPAIMDFF